MNAETATWVFGVALVPLLGWCIHITWHLQRCRDGVARLLNMHEHPEDYGFGTSRQTKVIEENTRAMRSLEHYIRWSLEKEHGMAPPPPPVYSSHDLGTP